MLERLLGKRGACLFRRKREGGHPDSTGDGGVGVTDLRFISLQGRRGNMETGFKTSNFE